MEELSYKIKLFFNSIRNFPAIDLQVLCPISYFLGPLKEKGVRSKESSFAKAMEDKFKFLAKFLQIPPFVFPCPVSHVPNSILCFPASRVPCPVSRVPYPVSDSNHFANEIYQSTKNFNQNNKLTHGCILDNNNR